MYWQDDMSRCEKPAGQHLSAFSLFEMTHEGIGLSLAPVQQFDNGSRTAGMLSIVSGSSRTIACVTPSLAKLSKAAGDCFRRSRNRFRLHGLLTG